MIKSISRLPLGALYLLGRFTYLIGYYIARYRHQVIREQLQKVFPAATEAERIALHKRFLKNFCDVLAELLKSYTMTAEQLRARVHMTNPELLHGYLAAGRSVLCVTSHLCNWEWLLQGVAIQLGHPVEAAYKPLHDVWAEKLMLKVRSRFGARLIPAKEILAEFIRQRAAPPRAVAMNADQAPVSTDQRFWTTFLGQDTAFYIGADQIARAMRLPVLYVLMRRVRRGFYEVELRELWDGKGRLEPNQVTERYARACEVDVLKSPTDWLWSYRRWRLKKPLYGTS